MYRNRALLDLCHEAPCLLLPGRHECEGSSEPCHSDMIRHGRGEYHKSHDCFAVPGCHNAHLAFTRSNLGKEGYHTAWIEAMECYILWQWASGKVRLADITQRAKDHAMEAPKCKICDHNHWAREPHVFGKNTNADESEARSAKIGKPREGKAPKGGERMARRSANSSGSRLTAAESSAGMRPSRPEAIDPAGGMPARIPDGQPVKPAATKRPAKPVRKRKPRTKIIATYTPPATAKKGGKKKCAQS